MLKRIMLKRIMFQRTMLRRTLISANQYDDTPSSKAHHPYLGGPHWCCKCNPALIISFPKPIRMHSIGYHLHLKNMYVRPCHGTAVCGACTVYSLVCGCVMWGFSGQLLAMEHVFGAQAIRTPRVDFPMGATHSGLADASVRAWGTLG